MEKVDDDLGKEVAEKELFIPTARIVFDLYWSFLSMLSYGIIPQDVHPGNIGLSANNPVIYQISNLTAAFGFPREEEEENEEAIGVKLIDYSFYNFGKERKKPMEIKHGAVMKYMNNVIIPSVIEEDKRALQVWKFLQELNTDLLSALVVLHHMLIKFFKQNLTTKKAPETFIVPTNQRLCDVLQRPRRIWLFNFGVVSRDRCKEQQEDLYFDT